MLKKSILAMALMVSALANASISNLTKYVNPFIGTASGSGNTYPGAQVPWGMISWSPQSVNCWSPGGYDFKSSKINGFGLIHFSGAGCPAVCDLPFMPCTGDLDISPATNRNAYSSVFYHADETATPGYYSVKLSTWKIGFENAVKARSGIAHIDFPAVAKANLVLKPNADDKGLEEGCIFIDPTNRTLSGWSKSGGFCGDTPNDYVVYFFAKFDRPFSAYGTWERDSRRPGTTSASGSKLASYITFDCSDDQRVTMKVGISFVSIANARLNLSEEIPDWDFASVKAAAIMEWNQCLNRIDIEGGSHEDMTIFYTALYHTLMLPSIYEDVNGEYRGMDNKVHTMANGHHFLATFSGWDTYRTQAQLWGLLYPEAASDFCSSFLAMARQTEYQGGGGLPIWSMFNDDTGVMCGYPADPYIANAYAFGATNFDVMALKNVMVDSGRNQRWCGCDYNVTWERLPEYEKYGYVPADVIDSSCSRTVEYAVADFAVSQMCKATGDEHNYDYFLKRSQGVFNLINTNQGYLQPKNKDGNWVTPFDCYSGKGFMEGNSAQYTWTIPYNLKRVFGMLGERRAKDELDELTSHLANGYNYHSKYYEAGNEPCFGVMPVYNWLNEPWKAQEKVRSVMLAYFFNAPVGMPGDDDSGAMSAWYIFNALGMYPEIPGVGGVTVLSPLFPKAFLNLPSGERITIVAQNASRTNRYIQSMTINGKSNSKLWLDINDLKKGASLKYVMGDKPNKYWGIASSDTPPSYGDNH